MTTPLNWQDFLKQAALADNCSCLHINNTQHALIKVSGSDAVSFLHAQLSNSVTGLRPGEVRFAAWCNAKGRVWTLLRYWKDDNSIILRLPADQLADTLKRLRMFVLRSDVLLEPLELDAVQFIGPSAESEARQYSEALSEPGYFVPLPGAWPVFEVWSPEPPASALQELPREWIALPRILIGIPEIFSDQREAWIPQMLNLDKLDAIDFKKGCYPGQEIVAKLHYKGGLKQRMIRARLDDASAIPSVNESILDSQGNKVATIIEVVKTPVTAWLLLVARTEALTETLLYEGHALNNLDND